MNPENKLPKSSFFEAASLFILEMGFAYLGLLVSFALLLLVVSWLFIS